MDRDEVRLGVDVLGALGLLHAEVAVALSADERIERDHTHAEAARTLGNQLADAPEAEDPERLLIKLHTGVLRAIPFTGDQRFVGLRDVSCERQQQRHRVLGRGHDVRLRRVGHDDPALSGRLDIDVVHADPRAPDRAQVGGLLNQLGGQLRGGADHDAVVNTDALSQFLIGPIDTDLDVEVLAQQVHARVADLLLDEDLQPLVAHDVTPFHDPVNTSGERLHVGGVDRREHPDPQLVAPQLAVGLDVDDPVGAQRRRNRGGVDRLAEVDRADDQRALRRITDERRRVGGLFSPAIQVRRRYPRACDTPVQATAIEHPADLIGEQEQRRDRGRVVRLVFQRVLKRRVQREECRDPALGGVHRARSAPVRRG